MARFQFYERKRLQVPGILLSIAFTILLVFAVSLKDRVLSRDDGILIGSIVVLELCVYILLRTFVLEVTIDQSGIHYRYPPLIRKRRTIAWERIAHLAIVRYQPMKQFLGWGYRRHQRLGQALTTEGNQGLYLVLQGDDRLLLGIRDVQALREYLSAQPQAAALWNGGETMRLE